jgi:AraC-like DNA-binding protein
MTAILMAAENLPAHVPSAGTEFIARTERFLADVEWLSGVKLVLHDRGGLTQWRWDLARYRHTCAYCQAVKRLPDGERRCHQSDVVEALEIARRERKPFFRRCYAGVSEVIVPVCRGVEVVALVFCGQMFRRAQDGLKEVSASIRSAMPIASEKRLWAVARVVDAYFRSNALLVDNLTDLERASQYAPRRLLDALHWLEQRLHENISVAEAARQAGYSISHFEHIFKRHMGVSLGEWRRMRRLRMAKHLLIATGLKAREIAAQVGYDDPAYFHRIFKQAEGMSPLAYRRAGRRIGHKAE